ncbi:porin family protein [Colwellia sp. D2M02]|uniref:porin family protein n=1 Tax=Colwellia sp. D2M02 TaxID=2841562 RepID=UPI001C08CB9B|nr:porin family protein [Colwellia sp. D2M02]MBU2893127.1 porin family protein [Colwellia sp. D2M02]
MLTTVTHLLDAHKDTVYHQVPLKYEQYCHYMNRFPLLVTFLGISLLAITNKALADSPYIGIDYMLTDIDIGGENAKPSIAGLRAGVSNNNIAFEAQYLLSTNTDNIYRMEFDLEESKALYVVFQSDTMQGFRFDVSLGYAMNDLAVTGPAETYNGTEEYSGFSWGVSLVQQLPYLDNTQIRLGYQSLYKDSDLEITGIALGLTYQF